MATKAEIKSRFKTNSIPTEKDFADLIDSGINKDDDGIERESGGGIHITGNGDTQEVLSFSRSDNPKQSPWKINLNPVGGSPGFNITDDKTASRLVINEETGNIGVGAVNPHTRLTVGGAIYFNSEILSPNKQGGYLSWNRSGSVGETNFINNRGEGKGGFEFINCDADGANMKSIGKVDGDGEWKLSELLVDGNIGIGVAKPETKLDVNGNISATGIRLKNSGCIKLTGDKDVDVITTDLGLYSTLPNRWMRFVTNEQPMYFFTDYKDASDGRIGTEPTLIVGSNRSVGISTAINTQPCARLAVNGAIYFNSESVTTNNQGGYLIWNRIGRGESCFVNNKGTGTGGFEFVNADADGSNERTIGKVSGGGEWKLPELRVDGNSTIGANLDVASKITIREGVSLKHNGCIKLIGDADVDLQTADLGLYSTKAGYNMRFVTNKAPMCFFTDYEDASGKRAGTARTLIIDTNGSVSVGNENPHARLTVNGAIYFDYESGSLNRQGGYLTWNRSKGGGETNFINNKGQGKGGFEFVNCDPDGSNLTAIGRVEGSGLWKFKDLDVSGSVSGTAFNRFSDRRIKKDITHADPAAGLNLLNQLMVTDYQYIDARNEQSYFTKGFIAQELETLVPQAVVSRQGFIPDIYEKPDSVTALNDHVIFAMTTPHGLSEGDIVKLVKPSGDAEKTVAVIDQNCFSVAGKADEYNDVMIYGKQVNDLKAVDYNHLFMLNISATQQLTKELAALKDDHDRLKAYVRSIEAGITLNVTENLPN
ncbi:Chaperone of endosialidase [Mucilaginibacter mallensis]|uniref:Chaperone of endosialidase n=1 Tax=Mucilaginibacter mallensis TaxID=652787 RepID=A0A1H1XUX0_MUCMA|nr:tail fiber domain-containing protein [Mucilaginibacter mallensis]SDT12546.1 Chaperone of endosialidase [Mucilaginibacter mallensis]